MDDPLKASMITAASGMQTQALRMQIVSQNLANARSTADQPGLDPYARKTVSFTQHLDRQTGVETVAVANISQDSTPFRLEHNPGHPGADENGFVKMPNVNPLVEMADMRQANRSYEANLQVIRNARQMMSATIDLLRRQ